MNNTNEKNQKNKSIAMLILSILLLILLIVIVGVAYARYISSVNGTISAQSAKMICNIDVQAGNTTNTTINPYCTVTLTNFNNSTDITQTDVAYSVEVTLNENSTLDALPAYYWEDANGTPVGERSQPLTGTLTKGNVDTQVYTVTFINEGESNVTTDIDFDLTAIQKGND